MSSSLTASGCHVLGVSVVKETVGLAVLDSQESWGGGEGFLAKRRDHVSILEIPHSSGVGVSGHSRLLLTVLMGNVTILTQT